jgi:hypothetical protein
MEGLGGVSIWRREGDEVRVFEQDEMKDWRCSYCVGL